MTSFNVLLDLLVIGLWIMNLNQSWYKTGWWNMKGLSVFFIVAFTLILLRDISAF